LTTKPSPRLRILLLEDDPVDAELIVHALREAVPVGTVRQADTRTEFVRILQEFVPDVILSDHAVADFDVLDAFRLVQVRAPGSAFILVSGRFEQRAAACIKAGAADFVLKGELSRLGPAVTTAMSLRAPLRSLSPRQRQVLQLLASGHSTRKIALDFNLSIKTVETHRSQMMSRLNIHDLPALVRYAVRVGIVSAGQGSD